MISTQALWWENVISFSNWKSKNIIKFLDYFSINEENNNNTQQLPLCLVELSHVFDLQINF